MIDKICEECGKVIEGYNDNQVELMMQQHNLKHLRDKRKKLEKGKAE